MNKQFSTSVLRPQERIAVESSADDKLRSLACDLYYYAFPMILMDVTMQQTTNVKSVTEVPGRAPINQFAHFRTYPKADAKDVVRFNFDTLYSLAWVDLNEGPIILSVPDTEGRYYLIPSLDMWSDVFCSLGSRTTGTKEGHYAYVPPGWKGNLPEDVVRISTPTSAIWVMGRVQTNGPADYENVHKIQEALKLTPLNQWGKNYHPPIVSALKGDVDASTPPLVQVGKLNGVEIIKRFADLLKRYPPHPNDYPILFKMKAIGLEPGRSWDPSKVDNTIIDAINAGMKQGQENVIAKIKTMVTPVNGWNILTDNVGTYGTSYLQRAVIALGGLGANLPADAIYPTAFLDSDGKPLDGAGKYVLHFDKGYLPPSDAFWSLTMYDNEGFQVPNPINRFAIGDRDQLNFNEDGSLDIYIQYDSPGAGKESNWLPSPKSGLIGPTMRIYAPRSEALEGTWRPPAMRRIN